MSVLVVGLSHRTAPLALLERATLPPGAVADLEAELCRGDHVAEAVVLSTCNRLEVYAEVSKFHGGVGELGTALAKSTGVALEELTEHLYVHYEGAAITHLFTVTCGLDSMAVGEAQVLGQVRTALRGAQEHGSAGRSLGQLLQNALRVGKRAHSETDLDRAGPSLVDAGLERAGEVLGSLTGRSVLVLGAGAMSGLAVAAAGRSGAGTVVVSSRTRERAERLAATVGGKSVPVEEMPRALAEADVVLACAGASGHLITTELARAAAAARDGRPQVYVDLALPRDVDPDVADLPGISVLDLEDLGRQLHARGLTQDLEDVRILIKDEVAAYLSARRAESVAPTVVALRAMARSVVDAELARLSTRLGGVDDRIRAELEQTVHRVVEKLLHTPTVRVKELAAEPGGGSYAEALRALFGLGTEPFESGDQEDTTRLHVDRLAAADSSPEVLR
jgi:glutamyl-tRNA reductase